MITLLYSYLTQFYRVYTLYQCSFIFVSLTHIAVSTVNRCSVHLCHVSHACRYSAFVLILSMVYVEIPCIS